MNQQPTLLTTSESGVVMREARGRSVDKLRALQEQTIATLGRVLGAARVCALVDYPDHANVGDSMIWLGEVRLLERMGIEVRYACSRHNYDRATLEQQIGPGGVILIHGGGNFGTLWPQHQQFREQLLLDFPQHAIVQMPQSINFEKDDATLASARTKIERHGNFALLVRDQPSYTFARSNFACQLELCPDMAFMIGSLRSKVRPAVDYFLLARTDKEKASSWSHVFEELPTGTWRCRDWLGSGLEEWLFGRAEDVGRRLVGEPARVNVNWAWLMHQEARARMQRGIRLLSQGRVVVTDRLHAHVLCALLEKPHVVLGDAHGKIRALFDTWSSGFACATWRDDPRESLEAARGLLAQAEAGS